MTVRLFTQKLRTGLPFLLVALAGGPAADAQTIYLTNGVVFTSDVNIIQLSSSGVPSMFVANPGISRFAFDSNGNIFGSNAYGDIKKITPAGSVSMFVEAIGDPTAVAFDANNNLYFSSNNDSAIKKITPGGVVSTFVSGITQPGALMFDTSGNLYVAQTTTNSVLKITPGAVVTTFATGLGSPQGMVFDTSGNFFVNNWTGNSIIKITPGGVQTTFATVTNPAGLAIDSAGNIFAVSGTNNSVYKITPAGSVSTFADYNSAIPLYNPGFIAMSPSAIPEPSTYAALLSAAGLAFAMWRRREVCASRQS